jgi:hypothetical protein
MKLDHERRPSSIVRLHDLWCKPALSCLRGSCLISVDLLVLVVFVPLLFGHLVALVAHSRSSEVQIVFSNAMAMYQRHFKIKLSNSPSHKFSANQS